MSTQSSRGLNLRGYRRRKAALDLDLNSAPPGDIWGQEGTSTQVRSQESQSRPQGNSIPITTIDVEAIDDDVIESSPRAFAAAKNNRRNRGITGMNVVDVESEEWNRITHINKRRRTAPNQTIINCDFYINLESSANSALRLTCLITQVDCSLIVEMLHISRGLIGVLWG
ncbi:hypothetical protein F8388_009136 [Cannabis sativa]|uniref:Uncharacterized protein n=1 Tax=Cannabis sativa TaxID=3483 RepID=A0A7J6GJK7_CANSA|nr:hypothetical protein F8388_009136 [Cannabis sativa]